MKMGGQTKIQAKIQKTERETNTQRCKNEKGAKNIQVEKIEGKNDKKQKNSKK